MFLFLYSKAKNAVYITKMDEKEQLHSILKLLSKI